jgi:hypothetical protein
MVVVLVLVLAAGAAIGGGGGSTFGGGAVSVAAMALVWGTLPFTGTGDSPAPTTAVILTSSSDPS